MPTEAPAPIVYICGASRGRYGPCRPAAEAKWVSEVTGRPLKAPRMVCCEHPRHFLRRRRFPLADSFCQMWELTDDEFRAATDDWDVFSLTMAPRIVCPECALEVKHERD